MTAIEKQISELGWTLCEPFTGKFCAFCRHFYTPQRNTPEEVLADVRQIKNDKPTK